MISSEVGYRKPPKQFQFKPGVSGNPNGRPKKKKQNLFSAFKDMMNEEVKARIDGSVRAMPKNEAMIRQLFAQAMQCNQQAFRKFLSLADKAGELIDNSPIVTGGVIELDRNGHPIPPIKSARERAAEKSYKSRSRKRGTPENLLTIFKRVLNEEITLANGLTMSKGQAVLSVNHQKALSGNQRAVHNILTLCEQQNLFKDLEDPKQTGGFILVGYRPKTEEEFREIYDKPMKIEKIPIEFADKK